MLSTPLKALLGVLGAIVVVGGVGYVSGAFDRFVAAPPMQIAAVPPAAAPAAKPGEPAAQPASAEPAAGATTGPAAAPAETKPADAAPSQPATAQAAIVPPTFDILRAEADGSIVIAGKAPAASNVEILAGSKVIGAAVAGPEGDFAVVIDKPLAPGGHQIVLRATDETRTVAMSTETAVVSIPETSSGQVLALVEQPGQPSKLITVPEPMVSTSAAPAAPAAADAPAADAPKPAETPAAAEPPKPADAVAAAEPSKPAEPAAAAADSTAAPAQPETKPAEQAPAEVAVAKPEPMPAAPAPGLVVEVKAIEIEGNKVFVAGVATPKTPVRAYANAVMLGETKSSETGEFLIEALVDLPVGDYIVRADLLADDGNKVLVRAQVPFRREAGEAIAAVAPAPQPAAQPSAPASGSPSVQAPAPAAIPAATAPTTTAAAPAAAPSTAAPSTSAPNGQVAAADPATVEAAVPKPDLAMPTEPPSVTSAPLQPADGAVIIRRGDSLWRISRRVYGRGVRYSTIYLANQKQIADPDRIWPGQVFAVPVKTTEGESADMEAVADQKASPEDVGTSTAIR